MRSKIDWTSIGMMFNFYRRFEECVVPGFGNMPRIDILPKRGNPVLACQYGRTVLARNTENDEREILD